MPRLEDLDLVAENFVVVVVVVVGVAFDWVGCNAVWRVMHLYGIHG